MVYIFNIFLFDKPLKFNGKISLSHKICYTPWYFGQHMSMAIFSGKIYFNDILWAQAYNNNTLLLRAIRYKKPRAQLWEDKRKRSNFLKLPISNINNLCCQEAWN
jgi:hypothetical protein